MMVTEDSKQADLTSQAVQGFPEDRRTGKTKFYTDGQKKDA